MPSDAFSLIIRAISGQTDEAVIAWLVAGFHNYLESGTDLDVALGLDRTSRMRARNRALQEAAQIIAGDQKPSWDTADRLRKAICRYQYLMANQCAFRNKALDDSPLNRLLLRVVLSGGVPIGQNQIWNIIK